MLVSEPDKEDYVQIKDALEALKKFLDRVSTSKGDEPAVKAHGSTLSMRRGTMMRNDLEYLTSNPELVGVAVRFS